VKRRGTLKAVDTCSGIFPKLVAVIFVLAKLTDGLKARLGDELEAFGNFQLFRIAEPDFRCPDGAIHMHPVVASGTLQRLPGYRWTVMC
jgi:hypothetical protein